MEHKSQKANIQIVSRERTHTQLQLFDGRDKTTYTLHHFPEITSLTLANIVTPASDLTPTGFKWSDFVAPYGLATRWNDEQTWYYSSLDDALSGKDFKVYGYGTFKGVGFEVNRDSLTNVAVLLMWIHRSDGCNAVHHVNALAKMYQNRSVDDLQQALDHISRAHAFCSRASDKPVDRSHTVFDTEGFFNEIMLSLVAFRHNLSRSEPGLYQGVEFVTPIDKLPQAESRVGAKRKLINRV